MHNGLSSGEPVHKYPEGARAFPVEFLDLPLPDRLIPCEREFRDQ